MTPIKLSTVAIFLGMAVALPQIYGMMNPAAYRAALRKFPRSQNWGYVLVGIGTVWFLWNLQQESIADFASYKPIMLAGFALLGILTCIFVSDFLAVRGLAIVLMLLGKLMVDTARWVQTPWRLVIVVWAYLFVIAGIWFTVSPWRLRDLIHWKTANDRRVRLLSTVRLLFGLLVVILGLTVF
jgi:hypothetical protein